MQERVERAIDTMKNAGLTDDQIREIVVAFCELYAEIAKDTANG